MKVTNDKKWKLRKNGKKILKVLLIKIYVYVAVKVPITPKIFWPAINLYIALSKILQKFFHLVETSIFCEFSKLFFFPARPSEAKTGASDIIPGFSGRVHQLVVM